MHCGRIPADHLSGRPGEGSLTLPAVNRASTFARTGPDGAYADRPPPYTVARCRRCRGRMCAPAAGPRRTKQSRQPLLRASTTWSMALREQGSVMVAQPLPPKGCRRSVRRTGCLYRRRRRGALHARFRRPATHRRIWPGRPHQFLLGRRQRPHRDAADRFGAGARAHDRRPCRATSPTSCVRATSASRMSRSRSRPTGRSSSSAKSRRPGSIPMSPT